jgi:catechol 2,3-dioxygenase-like lactoylglutathione lyase family enzyme
MIDDFQHVSVTCRDLEPSIHFYERLGLKVIQALWDTVDLFRPGQIDNTRSFFREVQHEGSSQCLGR